MKYFQIKLTNYIKYGKESRDIVCGMAFVVIKAHFIFNLLTLILTNEVNHINNIL